MQTLEEKLLQLAKENLSEMQVTAIKDMLEENHQSKITIEKLQSDLKQANLRIETLTNDFNNTSEKLETYKSRESELIKRESKCSEIEFECEKRNRNWDNELLKKEVEMLRTIAQNQSDLVSDVFRSPVYRSYVSGQHSVVRKDGYGNSMHEQLPFNQLVTQEEAKDHKHMIKPVLPDDIVKTTEGEIK